MEQIGDWRLPQRAWKRKFTSLPPAAQDEMRMRAEEWRLRSGAAAWRRFFGTELDGKLGLALA